MSEIFCLLFVLLSLFPSSFSNDGLDLIIKSNSDTGKAPRAVLSTSSGTNFCQLPESAFTFCFYVYFDKQGADDTTLVSYSSEDDEGIYNELYLVVSFTGGYTALSIRTTPEIFQKVPNLQEWTHICASWESNSGNISLFMNGKEVGGQGTEVHKGGTIGRKGHLVLGQDQDYYDGGYNPDQGLMGRMTQFNVWGRKLSEAEVNQVMNCSASGEEVNWSNSFWLFSDGVMLQPSTAPCFNACGEVRRNNDQEAGSTTAASEGTTSGTVQETTTAASDGTTSDTVQETTTAALEGTTSGAVQVTTTAASEGTTSGTVQETTTAASEGTTSGTVQVTTTAASEGTTSGTIQETTTASSEGTTSGTVQETTTSASEGTTSGTAQETTTASSEGTTSGVVQETTTAASDGTTSGRDQETTTAASEDTTSATGQQTTTAASEGTTSDTVQETSSAGAFAETTTAV